MFAINPFTDSNSPKGFVRSFWPVILLAISALLLFSSLINLNNSLTERSLASEDRERAVGLARPFNRLIRETLRLTIMVAQPDVYSDHDFFLQRDLIDARFFELSTIRSQRRMSEELREYYLDALGAWSALQPELDVFWADPDNAALQASLLEELARLEWIINRSDSHYIVRTADTEIRLAAAETRLSEAIVIAVTTLVIFILLVILNIYRFNRRLRLSYQEQRRVEAEYRISEEARAESQRFAARITEAVPNIVYIYDLVEDRNVYANHELAEWLGYTAAEVQAMGSALLPTLIHPNDLPVMMRRIEQVKQAQENEIIELEYQTRHKNGEWRWFSDRITVFSRTPDGAVSQYLGIAQDITARKRAEVELWQAKEASEMANKAKSVFLANMSHELRTPLNAILGFAQLMERDPALRPSQRENLEIIGRSGEHLLSLINDVLEMSKIEAGRAALELANFDLHETLDSLEEMFSLRAEAKGLRLVVERQTDTPRFIHGDERKLRQVLINLFSNAVKFTETGSVTLRVGRVDNPEKDEEADVYRLYFEMEDTGMGIAQEELPTLFEAFTLTASGQKSQEGTGLGLPISQQFVRLMGGEITVSSEWERGSRFRFEIEAGHAEETVAPAEAASLRRVIGLQPDQPVYRILIAEDKWTNRKLLRKLLEPVGFDIREAENGQEAVTIWTEWEPHLIWMDMRMPVMDGYEATRQIKTTIKGQATAIIALTASAFEHERAVILSIGCDDFVRKPFRETEIFEKIALHLGVRYLYDEPVGGYLVTTVNGDQQAGLAALAAMPAEWRRSLSQAAAQADADLVLTLVGQLPSEQTALSQALAQLVDDFRFDTIMELAAE